MLGSLLLLGPAVQELCQKLLATLGQQCDYGTPPPTNHPPTTHPPWATHPTHISTRPRRVERSEIVYLRWPVSGAISLIHVGVLYKIYTRPKRRLILTDINPKY